jgi:hypothetical protein
MVSPGGEGSRPGLSVGVLMRRLVAAGGVQKFRQKDL